MNTGLDSPHLVFLSYVVNRPLELKDLYFYFLEKQQLHLESLLTLLKLYICWELNFFFLDLGLSAF